MKYFKVKGTVVGITDLGVIANSSKKEAQLQVNRESLGQPVCHDCLSDANMTIEDIDLIEISEEEFDDILLNQEVIDDVTDN